MFVYFQIRFRVLILVVFFINSSCVKGVDFEQSTPVVITPIVEVGLAYINLIVPDFLNPLGGEISLVTDSFFLEELSEDFLNDYLVRADFNIEVINSLNKDFEIQIDFLDSSNSLQHSFILYIDNSPSNSPITSKHSEVFVDSKLEALKASNKLDIKISMLSNPTASVLTSGSIGSIVFKSTVVLYFEISE
tara:strand:+ start:113 stop:685 length:573 start_codon:yes stop_codon:yes gene_type:complete